LDIGFAKELADRAGDAITERESANDEARSLQRSAAYQHGQRDEQHKSFKQSFVELARMTRHRPAAWKHHRPRNVGWSAPQLAVDEIGDAAEKDPDRTRGAGQIPK